MIFIVVLCTILDFIRLLIEWLLRPRRTYEDMRRISQAEKEYIEQEHERQREIEANPLLQYSTSQLRKELRRRKSER